MAIHELDSTKVVQYYYDYAEGKQATNGYALQINGEIAQPSALDALAVLEQSVGIRDKAEFVRKLLKGCSVAVSLYGTPICDFTVTEGFQWFAVPELQRDPQALKFIVSAVYGVFLKNSVPHLTDSQRAVKAKMEQTA